MCSTGRCVARSCGNNFATAKNSSKIRGTSALTILFEDPLRDALLCYPWELAHPQLARRYVVSCVSVVMAFHDFRSLTRYSQSMRA